MNQQTPLDRGSFKLGLSALFDRLRKRELRANTVDWDDPGTLSELLQIQERTTSGEFDLDAVMDRLVKVTWKELGAAGVGLWLFTDNEIFYRAGAGEASNDEQLRLTVLSALTTVCQLSEHSGTQVGQPVEPCASRGAGPAPSYARSLLIAPIAQGQKIVGVLAAFSSELERFAARDFRRIQFLANLLAQVLHRVAESSQYVALERATMLQLVEGMIPVLRNMLSSDDRPSDATDEFMHASTWGEREPAPPHSRDDSATLGLQSEETAPGTTGSTTSERETAAPSIFQPGVRSKWDAALALVKHGSARANDALTVACTALGNRLERVGRQIWRMVAFRSDPTQSQPGPRPRRFLLNAWGSTHSQLKARFQSRFSILRTTPVTAVLIVAIGFLILKAGHHSPRQTNVSSSPIAKAETRVSADAGGPVYPNIAPSDNSALVPLEARVVHTAATPSPIQVSHLRVTDRSTLDALETLSHYELAALRRRALYGDDFAEFLIGMAHETGHGLEQNCKTAAEWVMKAAAQGNPAAEYNLGLRYRDGDGVSVNQDAALRWLRKAAAQHFPGAQASLMTAAAP